MRAVRPVVWIAAAILIGLSSDATAQVLAGIDVLERDRFERLAGSRVGLITNHTGTNLRGVSTVELLNAAENVNLVALFSPEHGFAGKLDQSTIGDSRDASTGVTIFSLYGEHRVPTAEMLQPIDTLVFDIQDIGTRFYTYISTMGGAMRAAAEHGVRVVVLDRPNPIDGITVQGPVLDAGSESFVGYHRIAVRHGMTVGELAHMFKAEMQLDLDLEIVLVEGWDRGKMFDHTGRVWINPSPNMRSLTQALLYPGMGLLETTNLSVGRGTDTPFEVIGAPWIEAIDFARDLNDRGLPGVRFVPLQFTPDASKFAEQSCGGVNVIITDRSTFHPIRTGLSIAVALRHHYPEQWETRSLNRLLASAKTRDGILAEKRVEELREAYQQELDDFQSRRKRYLIYPESE